MSAAATEAASSPQPRRSSSPTFSTGSTAPSAPASAAASATSTTTSLADQLISNLQPFSWESEEELALVKQYNNESLASAQKQSTIFDTIVHKWIADIEHQRGAFNTRINYWSAQLFRRHPVSTHILHLQMQRSMYNTSSLAYIILVLGNILKFFAFAASILFFFARHSPGLLPAALRPVAEAEPDTWGHTIYKYSIGFVIDKAFNTVQATVDIGYTAAIAVFIWIMATYISESLQNYSQILQRRYNLVRLERRFLDDFHRSIREQLVFYLKPVVFEAYKTFLAFPMQERSQLLGAYTRQDPEMKTVHTLLLNECEAIAFSTSMELLCTQQINEKTLKHMVELGTKEYIDCYALFIQSLKACGQKQIEDVKLQTIAAACLAANAGKEACKLAGSAVSLARAGLS